MSAALLPNANPIGMSSHTDGVNPMASALVENFEASPFFAPEARVRTLYFTNGDIYEGETLADLRHGNGKHTCSNGDTHVGEWYKGMRHGRGLAVFTRGFSYEGEFQYDHAHGSGKAKYENGSIYDGDLENDQRSGWGMQCFPDESVYVGEWAADNMNGKGRQTLQDGSLFEGTWKNGERVKGKWVSANRREEYAGEWRQGMRHGEGSALVEGFYQYTGEWQNDHQHGHGKARWIDGSAYDGMWARGVRAGQGVLTRVDGYKYDGSWQDDAENGTGNARFPNGDRFSGHFKDGKPQGKGRMQSADGDRYEGDWADGKRNGQGRCIFANGDKYQGEWVKDKRHGEGTCRFADGTLFEGLWQADQWLQTDADPGLSQVRGRGLGIAVAGQDTSFKIHAKDELRNRRLAGGDRFLVWLEGPATVHAAVKDNGDGTYVATHKATVAGMYQLYITNDTGESVADSPYPLRVLPSAPDPRKSAICTDGPATVGAAAEFRVEARDVFGNRNKIVDLQEAMPIECSLTSGSLACPVTTTPAPGGRFVCSYTPLAAGYFRLTVTSIGMPVGNSPLSIKVEGPPDAFVASSAHPELVDKVVEWERKAAQQYAEDGDADGWDSDASEPETAEQRYIREHPEVPVVENLEDMWLVTKLQNERKAKQEKEKALQEMRQLQDAQAASKGREPHPVAPVDPAAMSHLEHKMEQNSLASPPEDSVQSTDTHA